MRRIRGAMVLVVLLGAVAACLPDPGDGPRACTRAEVQRLERRLDLAERLGDAEGAAALRQDLLACGGTSSSTSTTVGLPSLSIQDASGPGLDLQDVTVTLSKASATPVTFKVTTTDGTATFNIDYLGYPVATPQTIPAGATSGTVQVLILCTKATTSRQFTLQLSDVVGATIADGTATYTIQPTSC